MGEGPNDLGLSRLHIQHACEASLERLGVDTIDLYQAHCWDPVTPLEETLAAFAELVAAGKVRYVGASNFAGWQLQRAALLGRLPGHAPVVTLQPQYSLPGTGATSRSRGPCSTRCRRSPTRTAPRWRGWRLPGSQVGRGDLHDPRHAHRGAAR